MAYSNQDKANCAYREVQQRKRVYRGLVANNRMTKEKADREIDMMEEICGEYATKHREEQAALAPSLDLAPPATPPEGGETLREAFREAQEARDAAGFVGTVADCIRFLAALSASQTPAPAAGQGVDAWQDSCEAVEAASAAFYDSMIGPERDFWPHHEGWKAKGEPFKAKVRERMRLALDAAVAVGASPLPKPTQTAPHETQIPEVNEDTPRCYMCGDIIGSDPFHTHQIEGDIHERCCSGEAPETQTAPAERGGQ